MRTSSDDRYGHCVLIRDSLKVPHIPDWMNRFVSDRHLHWLGGTQLTEIICLDIPEKYIDKAIAFLASNLKLRGFYTHIVVDRTLVVVLPGVSYRATQEDAAKLEEIRVRGREFGIPVSQMWFEGLFTADHPKRDPKENLPYDKQSLFRPSISGEDLHSQAFVGAACICGRLIDLHEGDNSVEGSLLFDGNPVHAVFPANSYPQVGDILGLQGHLLGDGSMPCIAVERWTILTPTLLPNIFSGNNMHREIEYLRDQRLRKAIHTRSKILAAARKFFSERSFLEVETPIVLSARDIAPVPHFSLTPSATGRHVLRICPENYLKRLVVSGFDRVFEIGRNFRVEEPGVERLSEFTALECYQAFASYEDMAALCHDLLVFIARSVQDGDTTVRAGEMVIDLSQPWRRLDFRTAVLDTTGIDISRYPEFAPLLQAMKENGIPHSGLRSRRECLNLLGEYVERTISTPTLLMDHPVETICVAKRHAKQRHYIERFELFIAGMELAHAFTELDDAVEQKERMQALLDEKTANGDEPHHLDEAFLSALEIGLPPTAGLGIGIDRLAMLLTSEPIDRVVTFVA